MEEPISSVTALAKKDWTFCIAGDAPCGTLFSKDPTGQNARIARHADDARDTILVATTLAGGEARCHP